MGSNYNFKNFVNQPPPEGGGAGRPPGNFLLTRQPSIYALTFDELQSTMGSIGKDFGSMNMDELLKNIWSAEELQAMGSAAGTAARDSVAPDGNLQRQGSLTLPRTLSQKTVDEVWRDMSKDLFSSGNGVSSSSVPQRQPTLGEVTLEEFLVRAGVVREDAQLGGNSNPIGFFGDLSRAANNQDLEFSYQHQPGSNGGMMGGRILDSSNPMSMESANLPLNVNGVRNAQQQLLTAHTQQSQQTQQQETQQQHNQRQQQSLLSKPTSSPYNGSMAVSSNPISSTGIKGGIVGIPDSTLNNAFVQSSALQGGNMGMAGLAAGGGVATGSPSVSLDGIVRTNGDTSSVSPSPYAFNGGSRGRRSSGLEKVVERRQRRMIKNRESAARSRARKQAYTMELEAELAKLKEENQELRKKQAEIMEIQKNQELEMMNQQHGGKRRRLRRTQTGPW